MIIKYDKRETERKDREEKAKLERHKELARKS
jgi:hypothetical protein